MTTPPFVPRPARVTDAFAAATEVADVLLFEGYVLYPYRASARKNQQRWSFGVLMPPAYGASSGEHAVTRTECLLEPRPGSLWTPTHRPDGVSGADGSTRVHVRVRFLQSQHRDVQAVSPDGFRPVPRLRLRDRDLVPWDEGVVREIDLDVDLSRVLDGGLEHAVRAPGGEDVEEVVEDGRLVGRQVRHREPLHGVLRLSAERLDGPYGAVRLRADLANVSPWVPGDGADRMAAARHALVAAHLLVGLTDATFLSLLDPPEWARAAAAGCVNEHTWPVLVGAGDRDDVVLSSPIILYDHPAVAPESPGDLYDATEIDEILSLRTIALTEEEKREARGTDRRAAAVIDRVDSMPAELLDRLHGTIRYLREVTGPGPEEPATPWWDPGGDPSVSPATDCVVVGGVRVAKGSQVRLRPRLHGTDAQDLFLVGRTATVEAVLRDVDDATHLAVTVDDDPGADLQRAEGRFLYFRPDEVELP